jgi:hypothetical protein
MNADFQKAKRDPQTYAIIGAAMEVHRQFEEASIARLRRGVRWQAERDTAFEWVVYFELGILPDSKAVSRPPHSKTVRRLMEFPRRLDNLRKSAQSADKIKGVAIG